MKNFAGYSDYYKSIDFGVEKENRVYSKLNPDQYYYNLGIQNYYLGTPRVLTKKAGIIPNLDNILVRKK
jgi:hypothetical protein